VKKNVLVFPCGSEIGLEIYKSLYASTHFNLIGGSSIGDHGEFVYRNYIDGLPFVDDPKFVEKLNDVIDEHTIDYVFPAHDSVLLKLAQAKSEKLLHCDVIASPADTCEVSRSKRETYKIFDGIIPTPRVFANAQEVGQQDLPVFLKPDVGQGSKGTYLAKTLEDIRFYVGKDSSLLLLEYLPGKEYTIDCFTSKDGEILFCEGRERKRISNGISVNSSRVEDPRFKELAQKINQKLTFRGAWFFQVKEDKDGELVLMEIASRIAGTMGLERAMGVNLPLLSLFDAMNFEVSVFENNYAMEIDRALQNKYRHNIEYTHVYIDFDDLVIFENKVNPAVMGFIYQCINNKVTTHLLTRHAEDLSKTLEKHHLTGVFDDLIWIKDRTPKSSYITEKPAIFIDDSFAEREEVLKKLGIPVFDAHSIEALLE
jgi:predicted ATP-grasp superfamily ATP-dependent carboligase